ncbi:MAG: 4'-phosphopantetheinyl transferase superfamily protein [Acidobacteriaceae bacterium]|nr:4'-phosphopantetheinyl transferase superfamily protein [Acidobacteriaceae bacterium]
MDPSTSPAGSRRVEHGVDVWIVDLSVASEIVTKAQRFLAPDEIKRANAFRFQDLRDRYVIAHAVLRCLLSRSVGILPETLCFIVGKNGKPALAQFPRLRFSLSHSEALAAFAITADCEVGIDLEYVKCVPDAARVASSFFCPAEQSELARIPKHSFLQAFYTTWVRKEAYVKAVGAGLAISLDSFRVSLLPDAPAKLLAAANDDVDAWALHSLPVNAGYVGAVAYRDRTRQMSVLQSTTAARILT